MKIRNSAALLSHGDKRPRERVLELVEAVLYEVDAGRRIGQIMRLEGDILTIGARSWDLARKRNIYLLGAGKACNAMAQAVCDVLGERLDKGIISVKIAEEADRYVNTDVYVGGHPVPNEEGLRAAQAMLELIDNASADDLFISVISGGSSALLACPVEGITLQEEMQAQDILLKSGAKVLEINAVRRHISRTNGGRLAERICHKTGAELISFMVGDGVGVLPAPDIRVPVEFYGTPAAADNTTIQDARDMIVNYDLRAKLPPSVVAYVFDDARIEETPKSFGDNHATFLLASVADSCQAAERAAEQMGIPLMVLSTYMEGESRDAGYTLSSIAREIRQFGRPIQSPCYVVCSGENTTVIDGTPKGTGGPGHEMMLGMSIGIRGMKGIAAASIDTEGTDGTTIYAGAITDGQTFARLEQQGVNAYEALRLHATGDAMHAIGDNILTGNTGTNLCDFTVFYMEEE